MNRVRRGWAACAALGFFAIAGISATPAGASSAQSFAEVIPGNSFAYHLLAAHNLEREQRGVAPLKWSARLAGQAQQWADRLASANRFEHATDRAGAGENLWMGPAGRYSAEAMIGGFIDERRYFRPGQFPNVSKTGSWHDIGHYTQLIWPATKEVGCAVSKSGINDILVCRYFPAGNVMGERIG
ncbi:CAP domain-containing protein [Novosphingobium tardum]|uniref:CAP domain-containing protein n=1 Tax=Novosphingobium tardum TaxID=1538021 RepID=A0ABV8RQT3_9SPHN